MVYEDTKLHMTNWIQQQSRQISFTGIISILFNEWKQSIVNRS